MRNLFLSLLVASCIFGGASAQNRIKKGFDPNIRIQDLSLDTWSNDNGLVSNNVNAVFQSEDDFLWITSYNGLQKFDGNKFLIFDQSNLIFLNSNAINNITEKNDGTLVFCTQSSGLFELKNDLFQTPSINDSYPSAITTVFNDSNDVLWLGSTNNGLYQVETEDKVTKHPLIPNVSIHDITQDQQGNIWIASDGQGVFRLSDNQVENFTEKSGLAGNLTMKLAVGNQNSMYVGSVNGLDIIQDTIVISIPKLKGTIINDIVPDDYGLIWLGTDRGLMRYDPVADNLEVFNESAGLPGNRVTSLCFDSEGSLWIGMYETGLARIKAGMISNLTIRDGLSTNQIYSIDALNDKFFIGTQDGKINVLENGRVSQINLEERFQKDAIRDFHFNDAGMWVANYMGLANIQGNKIAYYNEANGLPSNSLRKIFESAKGDMWLASRAAGLIRFDPSGSHDVYDKSKGLLSNYVMAIDEDLAGNLIIGTNAGGLSILTTSGTIENFKIRENDAGTIIFSLKAVGNKSAWLCTNMGLYFFKQGTIINIPLEGLRTQKFFDLIDDERGNLWLTSSIGVIQLKSADVDDYIVGKRKDVPHKLLGEGDGMESEECTGATSSYLEKSTGHLWIPTYEGVSILKPEQKVQNQKVPRVMITGMQVDNNLITPIKNNLIVQPGNFRYLFDVTALSFLAPKKVQFKYRLEGIESEWNGPTVERRIEYTNLPYGAYTLHVIGSNNDGIWNMKGDQLSFHVEPYFFETIWFRVIAGSLILISLYTLYRWRVKDISRTNKELTKMNRELDRFVYSASHDLREPLTIIMSAVDIASLDKNDSNHSEYLTIIQSSADKLDHFINGLINYTQNKNHEISKEKFHLATLISEIISELELLGKDRDVSIEQLISQEVVINSDRDRLKIIIKNLLHNAIIFSKGKANQPRIQIYFQNENEIIIKDNGVGISSKAKDKIFEMFFRGSVLSKGSGLGLYIAREAGEKIHVRIEVASQLEIGSEFKLILPIKAFN